jgi:tetratricopeptide (TPR) repeat protein
MKNRKNYIWVVFILIMTTNCSEDLLEKEVYGITTSENFYKNEVQIKQAVTEIYNNIRGIAYRDLPTTHFFIGDISTDDALKGGGSEADFNEGLQLQNFTNSSANFMIGAYWSSAYTIINRSNIVIEKAPDAAGDKDILDRYVREAKFLRAWAYFKLVTTFGGVPLILKDLPANDIYIARSTPDEVFEQIYKDLTDATALPTRSEYAPSDMGRATRGAAWSLMGKAYLFQENFSKAEEALKEVVESGEYELNEEFAWNFEYEHRNSRESVFAIQFKEIINVYNTGLQLVQFFSSRTTEGGWGFHLPTQDLWDAYDPDDPRLTYTFIRAGDRFKGDNYDQDAGMSSSGFHDRKIFVRKDEIVTYSNNVSKNWEVIRYSDVLLMYAEALNENGKSSVALPYLNAVRARARNSNPEDPKREKQDYIPPTDPSTSLADITTTDKAQVREAIWKERRLELAMEGHRRYDLVRQKRFGEVMRAYAAKYNTDKGKLFKDSRDYLLPIPSNEVLLSQGTLKQNPGF